MAKLAKGLPKSASLGRNWDEARLPEQLRVSSWTTSGQPSDIFGARRDRRLYSFPGRVASNCSANFRVIVPLLPSSVSPGDPQPKDYLAGFDDPVAPRWAGALAILEAAAPAYLDRLGPVGQEPPVHIRTHSETCHVYSTLLNKSSRRMIVPPPWVAHSWPKSGQKS